MSFYLGKHSLENLRGEHPDLVKVVKRANASWWSTARA